MITIRPARADDWAEYRRIRLRALREDAAAFGSTWENESQFDESTWRSRAGSGGVFLAVDDAGEDAAAVATATGYADPARPGDERQLVGMWVAPEHRGRGVAGRLVAAVLAWARADGAALVSLTVVVDNASARRAYARAGFVATGRLSPMPRNPRTLEEAMTRAL